MKKKLKLTKELCAGSGATISASQEDHQFKLVTCPVCRRQNLSGQNPREESGYIDVNHELEPRSVITVPPHRARTIIGQPAQG